MTQLLCIKKLKKIYKSKSDNEGDILLLKEWDPKTKAYTGRELERKVGYVGR